jgi:hypothetical protein
LYENSVIHPWAIDESLVLLQSLSLSVAYIVPFFFFFGGGNRIRPVTGLTVAIRFVGRLMGFAAAAAAARASASAAPPVA